MGDQGKDKNEYKKEMTAEEKKAQRAAKAAEKKMRAEAAAAKKEAVKKVEADASAAKKAALFYHLDQSPLAEKPPKQAAEKKKTPEKPKPEKKVTNEEIDELANKVAEIQLASEQIIVKSVIKNTPAGHGHDQQVKFDFSEQSFDSGSQTSSLDSTEEYQPFSPIPKDIHQSCISIVSQCDNMEITDIDELCKQFIIACKTMFTEFYQNKFELSRKYESPAHLLDAQVDYLLDKGKWNLPPALKNIYRMVRRQLKKIDENLSPEDAVEMVIDELETLENTQFKTASSEIAGHLEKKIKNGQSIVVYGGSKIIEDSMVQTLLEKEITVVVCDDECNPSDPNSPAYKFAKSLCSKGITVIYTELEGVAVSVSNASLIILPASGVFTNGGVSCQRGAFQIAMLAKSFNVPVVSLAHTYKFIDQIQPSGRMALLRRKNEEIVPPDLVTALVTEMRFLPPTSSPAVVKNKKLGEI